MVLQQLQKTNVVKTFGFANINFRNVNSKLVQQLFWNENCKTNGFSNIILEMCKSNGSSNVIGGNSVESIVQTTLFLETVVKQILLATLLLEML